MVLFGIHEVVLEKLEIEDLTLHGPILLLDLCATLSKFLTPQAMVLQLIIIRIICLSS